MVIFATAGAVAGATVRVKCPHCGKVQLRARDKHHYRCSSCHRAFETDKSGKVKPVSSSRRHGH